MALQKNTYFLVYGLDAQKKYDYFYKRNRLDKNQRLTW